MRPETRHKTQLSHHHPMAPAPYIYAFTKTFTLKCLLNMFEETCNMIWEEINTTRTPGRGNKPYKIRRLVRGPSCEAYPTSKCPTRMLARPATGNTHAQPQPLFPLIYVHITCPKICKKIQTKCPKICKTKLRQCPKICKKM